MKLRLRAAAIGLALITIVSMFASAASAQSGENIFAKRTIEVDGSGETRTSPDTADLDLAIDTQARTAEEAASSNAALATKVIDALKAKLGDQGKVTTGGYSLDPQYDNRPSERPRIIGYNAQNTVTVHTGALDLVGALIDSAIAAGANRVNSLKLQRQGRHQGAYRSDRNRDSRRARASRSARVGAGREARQGPQGDDVSEARPIPIRMGRAMAMSASVATPVEPGELTVPATVSLTFEIE